mmetsp:Transcript_9231/g.22424  ORF Transcript_9231/g.22424 Transcript_9231/m.22424 type:complete len:187 (-) Transcript_9231:1664-2224(-)
MEDQQNDPKYDFKAPEDNIQKWKPKSYESNAFQGVSPFDFAMRQKNEEKKRKEREREAKAKLYSYHAKGVSTLAEENAKAVNAVESARKEEARRMKEEAKHVNMAAAGFGVEQAARNADFEREKAWKEEKRNQKEIQKNVNMAAAGFGVEQAARNADFEREKAWKEAQRQQKEEQGKFDMARAIFK